MFPGSVFIAVADSPIDHLKHTAAPFSKTTMRIGKGIGMARALQ